MPIQKTFPIDQEAQTDTQKHSPQKLMAGEEFVGQPYLIITDEGLAMVADPKKVISISPEFGITLSGIISFSAMPEQISIGGGYWRFNPLNLTCIGSSAATPVPMLAKATPRLLEANKALSSNANNTESYFGF
jgi:hypothetical protein